MKTRTLLIAVLLAACAVTAGAQDIREAARKADDDHAAALARSREARERILEDREALTAEVERLEALQRELEADLDRLAQEEIDGAALLTRLEREWSESELEFREISGNVRLAARDLEAWLVQSPFSGLAPERLDRVSPILRQGYFPDIDDIAAMVEVYFDESQRSGQVSLIEGDFVGRDGRDTRGEIMSLGRFLNVYRHEGETGFLRYAPESRTFYALAELPGGGMARTMDAYLAGDGESMIIDMSGGAALRQITHRQSLGDQLRAGGPIVWPLGLIALTAIVLIVFKGASLRRIGRNTGRYMTRVNELASAGDWDGCDALVARHKGERSPVNHVIEAGLKSRHEDRETLESVLQEAILRELPRLERGLSTLAILGAVAPLLGLLGTVTGMIDTFRVITLFGTGDPKLMSGGISEALVTTELGLAIAIPIMLLHTFLSRRVDGIVGEMEEKAVSLTNIIHKERLHRA